MWENAHHMNAQLKKLLNNSKLIFIYFTLHVNQLINSFFIKITAAIKFYPWFLAPTQKRIIQTIAMYKYVIKVLKVSQEKVCTDFNNS